MRYILGLVSMYISDMAQTQFNFPCELIFDLIAMNLTFSTILWNERWMRNKTQCNSKLTVLSDLCSYSSHSMIDFILKKDAHDNWFVSWPKAHQIGAQLFIINHKIVSLTTPKWSWIAHSQLSQGPSSKTNQLQRHTQATHYPTYCSFSSIIQDEKGSQAFSVELEGKTPHWPKVLAGLIFSLFTIVE